ncbi:MAG: diguanylate cyclase [Syntrophaceae bacterium]|nr:diguanylate cyclase [Syntrophaceae bacterium]
MRWTISRKLLFGYMFMALLTLLVGAHAVFHLQRLNLAAYDITNRHFIVGETAKKMLDALLAQESAEKKYFIFKDSSLEQIYWQRAGDFKTGLEAIRKLNSGKYRDNNLHRLTILHDRYSSSFSQEVALLKEGRPEEAMALSDSSSKRAVEQMLSLLKSIQIRTDEAINDKMNLIARQSSEATTMTLVLGSLSLILGIALALLITQNISKPLRQLQQATGLIAEGKLDHEISVRRNDEIGALAKDFIYMTQRLRVLEEMNLDASPLTGLPGNIAIENMIGDMLAKGRVFSLCQIDLDNFKPFADKYGYAWGSEVIKEVGDILKEYVENKSGEEIFIGHIGGDDFVVIASPEQTKRVCQELVDDFERRIVRFYDVQDVQRGYIKGKDRQGVVQKFPLITISAAIVTDDGTRFKNPLDMAMTAAKLKEYAKTLPGNNYVTQEDWEKHNNLHPVVKQARLEMEHC